MHQSALQIKPQPISQVKLEKKKCETVNSRHGHPLYLMQEELRIKSHYIPAAIANINFIITSGLYFITTLSLDEIIAICMIDSMQKRPRHAQLLAANIPLM